MSNRWHKLQQNGFFLFQNSCWKPGDIIWMFFGIAKSGERVSFNPPWQLSKKIFHLSPSLMNDILFLHYLNKVEPEHQCRIGWHEGIKIDDAGGVSDPKNGKPEKMETD